MDKLRINLIPPEIKEKAKKEAKRGLAVRISIGLLGLLIVITVGILSVVIFQSVTIGNINAQIENEKNALTALRDKEALAYFLKNRIDTINKFAASQHTRNDMYDIISALLPPGVSVISMQIDKTENVTLNGDTGSTAALDTLFTNLSDPAHHEGKVESVAIESLNKGSNGVIRFSLILKMAKK